MITSLLKEKNLVIFDLDGTLFHSQLSFDSIRAELGVRPNVPLLEYIDTLHHKQKQHFQKLFVKLKSNVLSRVDCIQKFLSC